MIAVGQGAVGHRFSIEGNVGEVVIGNFWKFDGLKWILFKEALGGRERNMGAKEANCHEEGFVEILLKMVNCPLRDLLVWHAFGGNVGIFKSFP